MTASHGKRAGARPAQSRPDVERLGADVEPFQAAAYERTSEVIAAGREAVCGMRGPRDVVDLAAKQCVGRTKSTATPWAWPRPTDLLLVSTTRGSLYAFAEPRRRPQTTETPPRAATAPVCPGGRWIRQSAQAAEEILKKTGVSAGICLDLGCDDGQLALELVRRSELQVIGVEDDPAKVMSARRRLAAAGVYGSRVTVHQGNPADTGYPHYCADLIVSSRRLAVRLRS